MIAQNSWYIRKFSNEIEIKDKDSSEILKSATRLSGLSGNMPVTIPYHQDFIACFDSHSAYFDVNTWENSDNQVKICGLYHGPNIFSHPVPYTLILKK